MALPLLTLKTCGVGAPFPQTTVTLVLEFNPNTKRHFGAGALGFYGPTAKLTVVNNAGLLSEQLKVAMRKMEEWVCSGIVALKGAGNLISNGGREWSMTQDEFERSMAVVAHASGTPAPAVLTRRNWVLLDDNGHGYETFTFAVYTEGEGAAR